MASPCPPRFQTRRGVGWRRLLILTGLSAWAAALLTAPLPNAPAAFAAEAPPRKGQEWGDTPQRQLNALLQKKIKRSLQEGEKVEYVVTQTQPCNDGPFTAILTMPGVILEVAGCEQLNLTVTGEPCLLKKDAMQSAAREAVDCLLKAQETPKRQLDVLVFRMLGTRIKKGGIRYTVEPDGNVGPFTATVELPKDLRALGGATEAALVFTGSPSKSKIQAEHGAATLALESVRQMKPPAEQLLKRELKGRWKSTGDVRTELLESEDGVVTATITLQSLGQQFTGSASSSRKEAVQSAAEHAVQQLLK